MNEISELDQVNWKVHAPHKEPGGQYHGECGSSTDRTLEFPKEDEKNLL